MQADHSDQFNHSPQTCLDLLNARLDQSTLEGLEQDFEEAVETAAKTDELKAFKDDPNKPLSMWMCENYMWTSKNYYIGITLRDSYFSPKRSSKKNYPATTVKVFDSDDCFNVLAEGPSEQNFPYLLSGLQKAKVSTLIAVGPPTVFKREQYYDYMKGGESLTATEFFQAVMPKLRINENLIKDSNFKFYKYHSKEKGDFYIMHVPNWEDHSLPTFNENDKTVLAYFFQPGSPNSCFHCAAGLQRSVTLLLTKMVFLQAIEVNWKTIGDARAALKTAFEKVLEKKPYAGNPEQYKKILEWVEDLLKRRTLHFTAKVGDLLALRCLLEKDADPNITDNRGNTPLHYAAEKGDLRTLECLFKAKADINKNNGEGFTPLHIAVKYRNLAAIKFLLKNGANPNIPDNHGDTPLHLAVKQEDGYLAGVEYLLEYGANANRENNKKTPLAIALSKFNSQKDQKNRSVITALRKSIPGETVNWVKDELREYTSGIYNTIFNYSRSSTANRVIGALEKCKNPKNFTEIYNEMIKVFHEIKIDTYEQEDPFREKLEEIQEFLKQKMQMEITEKKVNQEETQEETLSQMAI